MIITFAILYFNFKQTANERQFHPSLVSKLTSAPSFNNHKIIFSYPVTIDTWRDDHPNTDKSFKSKFLFFS